MLNQIYKWYVDSWYGSILVAGGAGLIGLYFLYSENEWVFWLCQAIPFLLVVLSGSLGVHKFVVLDNKQGVLQLVGTGVIGYIGWVLLGLALFTLGM